MERDIAYIHDILESAELAVSYVAPASKEEFLKNVMLQDAVLRRFEIIGEAARRVSEATKSKYPNLPWTQMIGMRNIISHEYDDIDFHLVWAAVERDLPALIEQTQLILYP